MYITNRAKLVSAVLSYLTMQIAFPDLLARVTLRKYTGLYERKSTYEGLC